MVAIRRALAPQETAAAQERQGGKSRNRCGKLPQQSKAKTRDKVAEFTGVSGRTLDKATAVVEAAEAQTEKLGHLIFSHYKIHEGLTSFRLGLASLDAHPSHRPNRARVVRHAGGGGGF